MPNFSRLLSLITALLKICPLPEADIAEHLETPPDVIADACQHLFMQGIIVEYGSNPTLWKLRHGEAGKAELKMVPPEITAEEVRQHREWVKSLEEGRRAYKRGLKL